jgi:hypothetical protein
MATRFFSGARLVRAAPLFAVVLPLACSDSESPTSPASPRLSDRASIAGTLVAPGKTAESVEPLADVTVTVARTGQSALTDGAGRFALGDLPSGSVVLNFQGNGVKGAATLSLVAGATVRVTITLASGRSTVSIDPRSDNVALEGTVGSVNPGAASFVLVTNSGSPVIQTNSSTLFAKGSAPGSFGDLQPGSEVYLYGTRQSDGSILAAKVYIDPPPRPTPTATQTRTETTPTVTRTPSSVVALEGVVLSIDAGNARFVIQTGGSPVTILTNATTEFRKGDAPATFGDLTVGGEVYLYGNRQGDGSVLAFKVYIEVPNPTPTVTRTITETTPTPTRTVSQTVALEGVVLSIDAGNARFVIQTGGSPVTIQTNAATEFRKGDAPATFGDLTVGGEVYLYGNRQGDGSVLAFKVYIEVPNPTPTVTRTKTETTPTPTSTPTPTRTISQQVTLYGLVLSLDPANGRFILQTDGGPVTIQTNTATEFIKDNAPGSFGDLVVGGGAYAAGARQNDATVLASRVYIVTPKTPTPTLTPTKMESTPTPTRTVSQTVILYGLALSIDSANGRFVMQTDGGSITIQTNSATEFVKDNAPASFGDLVVGGGVYAAGTRQNDGSLLASKIVFPKTPTSTPTRTVTRTEATPTPTRTPSG